MLPPYSVRRSQRAKYPRIVINSKSGTPKLEVVLPKKFDESGVPSFVRQHEAWIAKNWEKQIASAGKKSTALPNEINLPAISEIWRFERDASIANCRLVWNNKILRTSPETNESSVAALLKKWLTRKAEHHLVPKIQTLAAGLNFGELKSVRVGCQRTLWGSCSRKGAINLNCRLLFLPPPLVRHIMIHELCHLREMNHSARFHSLLESLDGEAKKNSVLIRDQWAFVPGWIELA